MGRVEGVLKGSPKRSGGALRESPEESGRPERAALRAEERSEKGTGDEERGRGCGGARGQRQRDSEPGRDKAGGAGTRAGGLAAGHKDGSADGRTNGQTGKRAGAGQGRVGRGRRPSPRGAAAAPGGAGRAPGVRAEEAAATTWTGQTDGVTDGLAAAAASGGHSPSSLTQPGPRLRFCPHIRKLNHDVKR